jgi:hypothetical protein
LKATAAPGKGVCAASGGIAAQRRGGTVRLTIDRETLGKQQQGWLAKWVSTAEAAGCLAPGTGPEVAARILESLPLEPVVAWRLVNPSNIQAGYVDLGAENRLQVDSPILRPGAAADAPVTESAVTTGGTGGSINVDVKASSSLVGFETAWYAVRRKAKQVGFTIEPLSAERHVGGQVEAAAAPSTNYFRFAPEAGYYRLLYRADRTIIVIGAATHAEIERRTRELDVDPAACEKWTAHSCSVIPRNVGVNPDIVVMVNGRELALPIGATVMHAVRTSGEREPAKVLAKLTVQRLYGGRSAPVEFDRASQDILGLQLRGGEVLAW